MLFSAVYKYAEYYIYDVGCVYLGSREYRYLALACPAWGVLQGTKTSIKMHSCFKLLVQQRRRLGLDI